MRNKKLFELHFSFPFTYFIMITIKDESYNYKEFYKKIKNYLRNHDLNSHMKSVKEFNYNSNELNFYILYFTNNELDNSRIEKRFSKDFKIHFQKIPKTENSLEDFISCLKEIKENNKIETKIITRDRKSTEITESLNFSENQISIFDL